MGSLWLAAYPDGHMRGEARKRVYFEETTQRWVTNRLSIQVYALALISNRMGQWHESALTMWSDFFKRQRKYYSYPLDAYDVDVEEMYALQTPVSIFLKRSLKSGSGGSTPCISVKNPLFLAVWDVDAGLLPMDGSNSTIASDVLTGWRYDDSADMVPVLCMPFPMLQRILKREESRFMLTLQWHSSLNLSRNSSPPGPIPDYPPPDAVVWQNIGKFDRPGPVTESEKKAFEFNSSALKKLTRNVQLWSRKIVFPPERRRLEEVVSMLNHWESSLEKPPPLRAHDAATIVERIRLMRLLKGGGKAISEVVERVIKMSMPETFQVALVAAQKKTFICITTPVRVVIGHRNHLAAERA